VIYKVFSFYSLNLNSCTNPELSHSFFTNHFFVGANARANVAQGAGSYVPTFLSEVPKLFRKGIMTPDVALLNVSPPDKHGYCSLGIEVSASLAAAQTAKLIIAQINPNMPRTLGDGFIHYSQLDYIVHVDEPLPCAHLKQPGDVEKKMGEIIAHLIPDGATLQMGIGSLPNAVLASLVNHKNLGIHTEMFSDGVIDLVERGIVNNSQKYFQKGKTLTSFIMGSQKVYDFVNDNRGVVFMDSSVVNNPVIIGSNPKVTAINSAVEVDLSGQVCADSIGHKLISGVGGQVDFERGAALSEGGIPIICVPSVTSKGESRITATLKPGAGVVTTRNHVHWVVTEYGCVDLFGKNLIQRAKALICLAHPSHRERLEKEASEFLSVKAWEWGVTKV
jgi:acyl-CoA hydrolase